MGYTFQLLRLLGKRKEVFDVGRADGIVGTLLRRLLARPKLIRLDSKLRVPPFANVSPILVPLHRLGRVAEELDLHLLELAAAEGVIPRIDLVAERLADLGDAEGELEARAVEDVAEIDEYALGGFGAKIGLVGIILNRSWVRVEHQIKLTCLGEFAVAFGRRARSLPFLGSIL